MNFRKHKKDPLELSMTPMIDVVFLLLIFFMVTTTFNRETKLKVQLPEAQSEHSEVNKHLEITIDAQGIYFINSQQLVNQRMDTLKKALSDAAAQHKDQPLVISADAKTPHQSVITVLDVASQLNLTNITFATKAPKAQ